MTLSKLEELEQELSRAKAALQAVPGFSWSFNPLENRFQVDSTLWSRLGFSEDFSVTTLQEWIALQHPGDKERVTQAIESGCATRNQDTLAYRIMVPGGGNVWMFSTFQESRNAQGDVSSRSGWLFSMAFYRPEQLPDVIPGLLGTMGHPMWLESNDTIIWKSEELETNSAVSAHPDTQRGVAPRTNEQYIALVAPVDPTNPGQRLGFLVDTGASQGEVKRYKRIIERSRSNMESQSVFLAAMSHEIRTPVSSILGFVDLLIEDGLSPAQTEFANIIKSAGEDLTALVNNVLEFNRLESGEIAPSRRAVDLRELIIESCRISKLNVQGKDVEIMVSLSSDVPAPYISDSTIIRQILTSLISNALRHSDYPVVSLRVRVDKKNRPPCIVFLLGEVDDLDYEKLMVPFSKHNEEVCLRNGAGLDLAIVRRLVERIGGRVLTGKSNLGTIFVMELPLELDADAI